MMWFFASASMALAQSDAELAAQVDGRLRGDRTGACLAVGVVDRGHTAQTFRCASDLDAGRIGPDTAFEIGTHQRIPGPASMSLSWFVQTDGARTAYFHGGSTMGSSSFVAFDLDRQRGLVILSDTSWDQLGGLDELARPLMYGGALNGPRTETAPPASLLATLAGAYVLPRPMPAGDLPLELRVENAALVIQARGQPAFVLSFDTAGDFYAPALDARLEPLHDDGGTSFRWWQGNELVVARRVPSSP